MRSILPKPETALFFTGLLLTAAASSWYHWQPDDAGLAVDRCGMGWHSPGCWASQRPA
jgi:hypothetical protein